MIFENFGCEREAIVREGTLLDGLIDLQDCNGKGTYPDSGADEIGRTTGQVKHLQPGGAGYMSKPVEYAANSPKS